jgi:hypothetical protein
MTSMFPFFAGKKLKKLFRLRPLHVTGRHVIEVHGIFFGLQGAFNGLLNSGIGQFGHGILLPVGETFFLLYLINNYPKYRACQHMRAGRGGAWTFVGKARYPFSKRISQRRKHVRNDASGISPDRIL